MAAAREEADPTGREAGRGGQDEVPVQVQVLPRERRRRGHPGRHPQAALQAGSSIIRQRNSCRERFSGFASVIESRAKRERERKLVRLRS